MIQLYERALTIFETSYWPDHPQVAATLGNVGVTYRELGEHQRAIQLHERALTIDERVYGPDHIRTHQALRLLSRRLAL